MDGNAIGNCSRLLRSSRAARSSQLRLRWGLARDALHLTAALLLLDITPDAVLDLWELGPYCRASSLLHNEEQNYLHSLAHSICLQLAIPLAGPDPRKTMLVDAYLSEEKWSSGARKLFAHLDRGQSHTGQGFAVMGGYCPDPRLKGAGDAMTISVNPLTGLTLKDLWHELERMENERWLGQRPKTEPRPIASYPAGTGYTQALVGRSWPLYSTRKSPCSAGRKSWQPLGVDGCR